MRDTELYRAVLGLEDPWRVSRVELDLPGGQVTVWVEHASGIRWPCPTCGKLLAIYDHSEERSWRHLDTCQLRTYLRARVPRVECPEHGVLQTKVSWAEARSRFTLLMERLAIDVLLACTTTDGARKILRLSWDELRGVMDRAVERGLARKESRAIQRVGVDEKAVRKGHQYVTVVCDLDRGSVEHVSDGRTMESLASYWKSLSPAQRGQVKAVSMDMWAPYVVATVEAVPRAREKIVFDRFHIMKNVLEVVDAVRKREHRELRLEGEETLKGTKYLWLYSAENVPTKQWPLLLALRRLGLAIAKAWELKEALRTLWQFRSPHAAAAFFRHWFWRATHSRIPELQKLAHRLRGYENNILTFTRLRVTNGIAEAINAKIMTIKRRCCGFRTPEHFKTAIHFFCGQLDLYPR